MVAIRTLSATLAILAVSCGVAAAQSPVTNLNMRSGPSTAYQVLRVIPAGAPVAVLGCSGSWCRVNYAGRMGYANGTYLDGQSRVVMVAPGAAYASAGGYGYGPGAAYASAGGYGADYGYRRPFGYGAYGGYAGDGGYAGYGGYSGYGAYAADYGPGLMIGIGSSWNPAWRGGHN